MNCLEKEGMKIFMENFFDMNDEQLKDVLDNLNLEYEYFKSLNLNLDMSRGKPCSEQLDISNEMLDVITGKSDFITKNNIDVRNYGTFDGITELKEFISELTDIKKDNFIIGGNSSLSMMFDAITYFMTHGTNGQKPWIHQEKIKFLCPSPGYDRHFSICEYYGIEMISVKMQENGPDMDFIEDAVSSDFHIKGIWCVPKYSNPQGIVYSDEVVKRFANLKPAAPDFRIFWDNAYFVHDLVDKPINVLNIAKECERSNNLELPIIFYSTSKITFPGDGIAFMACFGENLRNFKEMYSVKTVGFDKLNQLRHFRFLKDKDNLSNHMKKHRDILKPKFDMVINSFEKHFSKNPIIKWNSPIGGYFVSVDTMPNCAKLTVELCRNLGVKLTDAGATFPYKFDECDTNIRIAPTYPCTEDLRTAIDVFCLCSKIAFLKNKFKNEGC